MNAIYPNTFYPIKELSNLSEPQQSSEETILRNCLSALSPFKDTLPLDELFRRENVRDAFLELPHLFSSNPFQMENLLKWLETINDLSLEHTDIPVKDMTGLFLIHHASQFEEENFIHCYEIWAKAKKLIEDPKIFKIGLIITVLPELAKESQEAILNHGDNAIELLLDKIDKHFHILAIQKDRKGECILLPILEPIACSLSEFKARYCEKILEKAQACEGKNKIELFQALIEPISHWDKELREELIETFGLHLWNCAQEWLEMQKGIFLPRFSKPFLIIAVAKLYIQEAEKMIPQEYREIHQQIAELKKSFSKMSY